MPTHGAAMHTANPAELIKTIDIIEPPVFIYHRQDGGFTTAPSP